MSTSFNKGLLLVCAPFVSLAVVGSVVYAANDKPDPLVTDGIWAVPEDIGYGTYETYPADRSGYWELCADYICKSRYDQDGNYVSGRIDNGVVAFPGTLDVTLDTKFVRVEHLYLKTVP